MIRGFSFCTCLDESALAQEFPKLRCYCRCLRILVNWIHCLFEATKQRYLIVIKYVIQEHNIVARVRIEPRSCDQGRRKIDTFTLSARYWPCINENTPSSCYVNCTVKVICLKLTLSWPTQLGEKRCNIAIIEKRHSVTRMWAESSSYDRLCRFCTFSKTNLEVLHFDRCKKLHNIDTHSQIRKAWLHKIARIYNCIWDY